MLRELPDSNLANARFQIQVSQTPSPEGISYPHRDGEVREQVISGAVQTRWSFFPPPGARSQAPWAVASGGEANRLMLALKSVLMASDDVPVTWVFDEVDTGIGGSTALAVGAVGGTCPAPLGGPMCNPFGSGGRVVITTWLSIRKSAAALPE